MNETGKKRGVVRVGVGRFLKKETRRGLVCREGGREGAIEGKMEGLEAVKEQRVGAPGWRGVYAGGLPSLCGIAFFVTGEGNHKTMESAG